MVIRMCEIEWEVFNGESHNGEGGIIVEKLFKAKNTSQGV